jgi:hypothetical protein
VQKLKWLFSGVAIGFLAAHFVNQTTEGRRFFDRIGQAGREFSDAVVNGYRDGESVVDATWGDVEDALEGLRDKTSD